MIDNIRFSTRIDSSVHHASFCTSSQNALQSCSRLAGRSCRYWYSGAFLLLSDDQPASLVDEWTACGFFDANANVKDRPTNEPSP